MCADGVQEGVDSVTDELLRGARAGEHPTYVLFPGPGEWRQGPGGRAGQGWRCAACVSAAGQGRAVPKFRPGYGMLSVSGRYC